MSSLDSPPLRDARETFDILADISRILNTGLDRQQLATIVQLCELGVNPEALAAVVKEVRRERLSMGGSGGGVPVSAERGAPTTQTGVSATASSSSLAASLAAARRDTALHSTAPSLAAPATLSRPASSSEYLSPRPSMPNPASRFMGSASLGSSASYGGPGVAGIGPRGL